MAIIINIDVHVGEKENERHCTCGQSRHHDGQHFRLENGKAKAIRLSTLEAICKALECHPEIFGIPKNGTSDAAILAQRNSHNKQRVGRTKVGRRE